MSKGGIIATVIAIPASIVALIQISNWIAPNTAKLNAFVKRDKVEIPSTYREYLRAVDLPNGRKELITIHDAAAAVLKVQGSSQSTLAALGAFANSIPIFTFTDPQVITVKIVNIGGKIANNIKVFLPNDGFLEVTKDGAPIISEQEKKGWIDLLTLEPSSQFIVNFWTASVGDVSDVRVVSDEGTVQLRPWYVSREENHWIVGFGLDDILFFLFPALVVFGGILLFILAMLQRRLQRIEAHEGLSSVKPPK